MSLTTIIARRQLSSISACRSAGSDRPVPFLCGCVSRSRYEPDASQTSGVLWCRRLAAPPVVPAISMRLFSEEMRSSFHRAMITSFSGVNHRSFSANYLNAVVMMLGLMLLPTLLYAWVLAKVSARPPVQARSPRAISTSSFPASSTSPWERFVRQPHEQPDSGVPGLTVHSAGESCWRPASGRAFCPGVDATGMRGSRSMLESGLCKGRDRSSSCHFLFRRFPCCRSCWPASHFVRGGSDDAPLFVLVLDRHPRPARRSRVDLSANVLAGRFCFRFDVTATGEHQLSPRADAVLTRLPGPARLIVPLISGVQARSLSRYRGRARPVSASGKLK